jgi:NTE family protein
MFAIEDLISDGIMSIEEDDEIMKEATEILITEQLLYRKTKQEVIEAYDRCVKKMKDKNLSSERKEIVINPGRHIISLISEINSMRLTNQ